MYSFFLLKNVLFAESDKCCELLKTKCQPMRSKVMWWCQISDSILQNIPSQTFPLNAFIPIQMHLFIFSIEKMYYLHKATSAVSCVKPNASQWEASCDDVGFPTVYRRIYHRKFFSLSNQKAGLGGSVGYAFDWRPGSREFNPLPRLATFFRGDWWWNIFYGHSLPSADSRRADVSFWQKNVHNTC